MHVKKLFLAHYILDNFVIIFVIVASPVTINSDSTIKQLPQKTNNDDFDVVTDTDDVIKNTDDVIGSNEGDEGYYVDGGNIANKNMIVIVDEEFNNNNNNNDRNRNQTTTATPTADNQYSEFAFFFNTIVIGAVTVLGLFGNLVSILVMQRDRHNRVAIFLLQVLALADSFVLVMSFSLLTIHYGYLKKYSTDVFNMIQPYMVVFVNPIAYISHCFVIWFTVLLALNRYAAICKPFQSKAWLKLSSTRIQVFVVLLASILLNIPRFFLYEIKHCYKDEQSNGLNVTETCLDAYEASNFMLNNSSYVLHPTYKPAALYNNRHFYLYYFTVFYTSVILILPLILLVLLNVPLIKQLQASKKQMKNNCLVYDGKNEDNITWTMIVIILEMVICHTPERICEIARYANTGSPVWFLIVQNISNFFVILNSSTDFIVYYALRKRFRKEFWRKIYGCAGVEKNFCSDDDRRQSQSFRPSGARGSLKGCTSSQPMERNMELDMFQFRRLSQPCKMSSKSDCDQGDNKIKTVPRASKSDEDLLDWRCRNRYLELKWATNSNKDQLSNEENQMKELLPQQHDHQQPQRQPQQQLQQQPQQQPQLQQQQSHQKQQQQTTHCQVYRELNSEKINKSNENSEQNSNNNNNALYDNHLHNNDEHTPLHQQQQLQQQQQQQHRIPQQQQKVTFILEETPKLNGDLPNRPNNHLTNGRINGL